MIRDPKRRAHRPPSRAEAELAAVPFEHGVDQALDVELVRFDERFPAAGSAHSPWEPHRPRFYLVAFYTEGHGFHDVDVQRYPCARGTMLFVGPGQVQRLEQSSKLRGYFLVFTPAALDGCRLLSGSSSVTGLFNQHLFSPHVTLDEPQCASFERLAQDILVEQTGRRDVVQREVLHHLLGIWLVRCQRFADVMTLRARCRSFDDFQRFLVLLEARRHETRNALDYARALGVSMSRLSHIVREATGKTPKRLIDEDLVLEIKRRLVHRGNSVGQIAVELGFEETTNLVKYFKRHTGSTPGAFRETQDLPDSDEH